MLDMHGGYVVLPTKISMECLGSPCIPQSSSRSFGTDGRGLAKLGTWL